MEPAHISFTQREIPKEDENIQKERKLYFLSRTYENGYPCSKDIEEVSFDSLYDRENIESNIFWNIFKHSETIIIIDKFFENEDIHKAAKIMEELNINNKINFNIFELYIENFENKKEALNRIKRILQEKFIVYELKEKFVHDRFAILNNELFHFGCTVGGKTKEGFSAYSCGWEASKIDSLIKYLKKDSKYSERRM